jgi:hypothetical protein
LTAIGATSPSTDGSIKDRELGWQYSASRARPPPQPFARRHDDDQGCQQHADVLIACCTQRETPKREEARRDRDRLRGEILAMTGMG